MRKIMIVEDDPAIREELALLLENEGYQALAVTDFGDVPGQAGTFGPDLVLLDLGLPGRDGFSLCAELRRRCPVPIVVVTSRNSAADELRALSLGGDDYITKPYSLKELAARVYAQVRRSAMKGFAIDHQNQLLREGNRIIPLAQKEFDLFLFLMGNPGRIISATELYQKVWCTGKPDAANSVAVYIARLRHKLEESQFVFRIETVRGEGYRYVPTSKTR